jgi:hypothetical protein
MNAKKRSTVHDSAASAPAREILKLPSRNEAEQAKTDLTTWEGEGGAVAHPANDGGKPLLLRIIADDGGEAPR